MKPRRVSHDLRQRYDRLAPHYDERWRKYVERTTGETVRRLRLRPRARVLDLACGTGSLTRAIMLAEPGARVVGLDLSRVMLRHGIAAGARWDGAVQGDAGALPFRAAAFDLVVSSNAFHFWPEPRVVLREIQRVLRPGGECVITDWCDDYLACWVCSRVLRWLDPSNGRIVGVRDCRAHLDAAAFRVESIDRYRISLLWGMLTARCSR